MTISPDKKDFFTIFHVLGRLAIGLAAAMFIPFFVALVYKEIGPLYDFSIAISIAAIVGISLILIFPLKKDISLIHTFFIDRKSVV